MPSELQKLMSTLADVRRRLASHGIRDTSDYAELLVAKAFGGTRENYINKGYDVVTPSHGRIEVKSRAQPEHGRLEERVELGQGKLLGFDHLAIVILGSDYRVRKGVIIPYAQVWEAITTQKYRRISFEQARLLHGAVDITEKLRSTESVL